MLVVGASYSAEDIALQTKKYGAESVTISYRTNPMGFHWPEGVEEIQLISRFEGSNVHFQDGNVREIDAVVLCTGYLHSFPFMEESLRLRTHNRLFPGVLYKGVVWIDNPKVMYLGMQEPYYTFSMFDAQAWYARDIITGKIALPSKAEMEADASAWQTREEALEDPNPGNRLPDRLLQGPVRGARLRARLRRGMRELQGTGSTTRSTTSSPIATGAHPSPITGTEAPIHHTPWWEAMDDSMEDFLATK